MNTHCLVAWWILLWLAACLPTNAFGQNSTERNSLASEQDVGEVVAVSASLREKLKLDDFYQKHIDVDGFPVLGSKRVSDAALSEAAWIVRQLLGKRPDILKAMAANKTRLTVMAYNEYTSDVPEHRHLSPRVFWDRRARGLGATPAAPAVSCAEENLLGHPNDPYNTENICIHEFAHAIHIMGLSQVDPSFDDRLKQAFQQAIKAGRWKDTYAATNRQEYWAEAVQSWFDNNRADDALHNHVDTRQELKEYDPALARLCEQVFGDRAWRYQKPLERSPQGRRHLKDVNFDKLPPFRWRQEEIAPDTKVLIQTTMGDIEIELAAEQAPVTVKNFVDYVHRGFYADGQFHRTVGPENQPENPIKIAVIQASADPEKSKSFPDPIPLERTRDTGLKHLNGTISMARSQNPDSGRDHFFICIGDQPELDFGGRRNPDGQGFAAFGRVTKGMEIVKKIHQANAKGQRLDPPIKIQRAIRLK